MRNILLYLFLFFTATLVAQNPNPDKTSLKLMEKVDAEPDAWHSVHILLADRVDLYALDAELSSRRANRAERSRTVVAALQAKTEATQKELLSFLRNHPDVKTETVNSYWVANAIFATMKKGVVVELSEHAEVEWLGLNGALQLEKFERVEAAPPVSPDGIEPGLEAIDATKLWAMGYTGYGQIALTSDTGIDPSHPALKSRNRNFYAPNEHTWYQLDPDTFEPSDQFDPFDCGDHGTHVTGTMLGLDRLTNDTIGVAFNAHWMGAPTLCGIGTEDNIATFQWSLDPDGDPNTFDDIPTVINNSWWDPSLDTLDCVSLYVPILEATEVAGIAVVFSAGNGGPNPMTITQPKNIIINEVNPFTVGSLNGNNLNFPISNFSSRGPSHCDGDSSLLIKPEVSAPGQSVRSSIPGPDYDFFSGTSMAAPHTSGAIMLLAEAFPDLPGKDLKLALYHTCMDLGEPGEDNIFGQGIINVMEAFNYLVDQGHTPVSPYRANDIMMVDMVLPTYACDGAVAPFLIAENAGTDTIYSFEIFYEAGGNSTIDTWAGVLAPRERVSLNVPPLAAPNGIHDVFVAVQTPNGVEDERPLNNNFRGQTRVSDRAKLVAELEGAESVCEGTSALLRAESPYGPGTMEVSWFENALDTDPISTDEAYLTPALTSNATYFAEANYFVPLGPENSEALSDAQLDTSGNGLRFEVYVDLVLKSLHVELEETGGRLFILTDENGEAISSSVQFINEVGRQNIELNWALEPGIYEIVLEAGKPLFSNFSGATFPQEIDGVFAITGPAGGGAPNGIWRYFYDWEIEFLEPCGRTPVEVEVGPSGDAPIAGFTVSADTVSTEDTAPLQFTNTSQGAVSYFWNFGDGTSSEEESPAHLFEEAGVYTVSLVTTGNDGCTDAFVQTIVVEEPTFSSTRPDKLPEVDNVAVYPNPIADLLTVHLELTSASPITLRLTDISGRQVATSKYPALQKGQLQMEVESLPDGVYFLLVETARSGSTWKVVKI